VELKGAPVNTPGTVDDGSDLKLLLDKDLPKTFSKVSTKISSPFTVYGKNAVMPADVIGWHAQNGALDMLSPAPSDFASSSAKAHMIASPLQCLVALFPYGKG